MTTGGPLGERLVTAPHLLDLCDQALGEISRRRHLFSWLRGPGDDEWLAVDAYYPANRLVVMCRERPTASDELIAERVPEHGLRLLALAPDELAGDPAGVDAAVRRRLEQFRRSEPAPAPRLPPAVPSHRKPTRPSQPRTIRRNPTAVAAPPARRHPLAAALLIAALFTVFVIALAIVTAAHG